MNNELLLPPHFWLLLALCLLVFALSWWFVLAGGRVARRSALRRRIAALDARASPSLPLDLAGMQKAMDSARRAAEHAPQRSRRPLYALPWFLFIGDAHANLPSLLEAASEAPLTTLPGDDAFWQWRFLRSMMAIAINPQALADPADPRQRGRWYRALLQLVERRKRLALNGIVVCISTAALVNEAVLEIATGLRALIDDVAAHLRLHLPVYLVVTGLEKLEGYELVRAALPAEVLEQALGHRLRGTVPAELSAGARFDALFDDLSRHLDALRMALLREQRGADGKLAAHRFVERMRALKPALRVTAERLFGDARPSAALRWRGIYFTGATESGGAFVWDLFAHFLPADQPLAHSSK